MTWGDPRFSDLLAAAYLGLLTLMWLGLVLGVDGWGRKWRLAPPESDGGPLEDAGAPVLVSVLVPARDEAHNIGACVEAALAGRGAALEVVVVDDRSTDGTRARAAEAAAGDARFRVIEGTPPPPGWAGKPWACARAAGEATGTHLLFIDADVRLHPDAVRGLVAELVRRDVAMLSAFGTWTLVGFWERAVIPAVGWLIRGAVDLDRVNDPGRVEAFANGQLILVRRGPYEAAGGHGAVRDQVLDDVRLAEAMKRTGVPLGLVVAPWAFQVRLYRSLSEIVAGYGKNLYEGMGRQPVVGLGAVLFIVVGTLVPYFAVLAGLVARLGLGWGMPGWGWIAWFAVICALQLLFRYRVERRDGRDGAAAWTHPIANGVLVWILLRSVFGLRSQWKGRTFVDGRAAGGTETGDADP